MQKVLIANRGEIALRVIRACRELDLQTVAVFSTADQDALHVRRADEAVCIGPPHARESYLNVEAMLQAARQSGADAVHPGYGFLAENADFAAACRDEGLVFVGPSPEAIEAMGDKVAARRLAARAGAPTIPGTEGTTSIDEALEVAGEIGYPVLIKAAAGGGGRGIRAARAEEELAELLAQAAMEADAAFGDGSLYLEKMLVDARHVEVQVLGDAHGNLIHLFERECSLQRRRQKLFEESPSPALDADTRNAMTGAALGIAAAVGYENAGTIEFLLDRDGALLLHRDEHAHPGRASGHRARHRHRPRQGAAAGRPRRAALRPSGRGRGRRRRDRGPDQRRGSGARLPPAHQARSRRWSCRAARAFGSTPRRYAGYHVPPFYDSLVAKLICSGRDRAEAIARTRRALEEFMVEGIRTTIPFHLELLADPAVEAGDYHVEFLERRAEESGRITQ